MNPAWYADPTLQTVALGGALIGGISGALGTLAYLRRESLIGDVVAHSSLLGILAAFLVGYAVTGTGGKQAWLLLPGAMLAGLLAAATVSWITTRTRLAPDAALGVMLALYFGSAMTLLRWVQRRSPAIPGRAGLDEYLFGMAAATTRADVLMIACIGAIAIAALVCFWVPIKWFVFDPEHMRSMGGVTWPVRLLTMMLLVVAIVIGLQTVGVILMVSLLIAPAAAARQWTNHLSMMVVLSAAIGASVCATGAILSGVIGRLPTGPVIVILVTVVFAISILFSPSRGVLTSRWRRVA
ncbi:MAG: metal ABC transporter permease [Planctomycetota bacterium]